MIRLAALVVLFFSAPVYAAGIDAQQQALLFLRILAGDHNLKQRAGGGKATVAVVFSPSDHDSTVAGTEIVRALERIAEKSTVAGLPLHPLALPFDKSFDSQIAANQPIGLYVCSGLGDAIASIVSAAKHHSILTATGSEDFVHKGLAVGFAIRNDRLALLINTQASKDAGVDFDPSVLKLAELVHTDTAH